MPTRALILVDLQNDFLPGGALAVPQGDEVIPVANQMQERFTIVVATQDWHPAEHGSFAANHSGASVGEIHRLAGLSQIMWPVHCVQGTYGAQFAPQLHQQRICRIVQKGTDPQIDSYSGFFDNGHRRSTGLGEYLKQHHVRDVYVLGLATDYCVKYTALDARKLGLTTWLIDDGCRGVEMQPGDVARALDEMRAAGVQIISSRDVTSEVGCAQETGR